MVALDIISWAEKGIGVTLIGDPCRSRELHQDIVITTDTEYHKAIGPNLELFTQDTAVNTLLQQLPNIVGMGIGNLNAISYLFANASAIRATLAAHPDFRWLPMR